MEPNYKLLNIRMAFGEKILLLSVMVKLLFEAITWRFIGVFQFFNFNSEEWKELSIFDRNHLFYLFVLISVVSPLGIEY
jgi:hypothetical protein